ncbi:hypothetical protein ACHAQD_008628 [Fusarium lateritium]
MQDKSWQEVVAEKKQQQADAISAFISTELSNIENQETHYSSITSIDDVAVLAQKIASGQFSSEDVTKAYISRNVEAIEAHKKTNCLTEILFKDALAQAQELDRHFAKEGKTTGPFHGVPISLKDQFNVKGYDTTLGYTSRAFKPASEDAVLVNILKKLGAIMICKTNLPQSIMSSRLPYAGVPVSTDGQEHVPSSIGPLARSLSSIYELTREITLQEPWTIDCRCIPIPWRQNAYDDILKRKLTIGVLRDDGVVKPHPSISRVIENAVTALAADGHELVEWKPEFHAECIEVMDAYFTVDGGEDIRREVEAGGEPFIPAVERLVNRGKPISVYDYWQLNKRKRELQQAYLEKWNNTLSAKGKTVDAIITPVLPHSAVPHRSIRWVGYTKVWNLLDYTALVIPGGCVEPQDLEAKWGHEPRNEMDAWNRHLWEENRNDMGKSRLPVDIQIVGRNLEEEKVLAIGKVVDDLLRAR